MRKTFFYIALLTASVLLPATAEVLVLPEPEVAAVAVPQRGASQADVVKAFGAARVEHPAAGGGSAVHPPITRWDYDGFSVFFENSTVIDVVVKDRPAPIHHMDELRPQP